MAYLFDQIFAADPANPSNVARNAAITIFQPGDPTKTPLVITDPSGGALTNPVPVNANGFGSAFIHATLDRVAWDGGGFTGFFTSYEGMKEVAVAAVAAAEAAAADAGAEAAAAANLAIGDATVAAETAATSAATAQAEAAASATAAANSAALVGAPADSAIAAAVNNGASATKTALNSAYAPRQQTLREQLAATLDGQTDVRAMANAAAMTTPPTFTYSATTTLTGSSLAAHNDSRFRKSGAETFTGNVAGKDFLLPQAPTGVTPAGSDYVWRVEFDFDGSDFELIARCSATAKWRIWVDGQPHAAAPVNYTVTDNTAQFVKVAFGSRAYRRIMFEGEGNWYFGGIQHRPTDTVITPNTKRGPRLAVTGDSYAVATAGGNTRALGYVGKMCRLLGARDYYQSTAAGGTGLINPGSYLKYLDRLGDVTRIAPDIVLVQGTLNDGAYTATQVKDAAITYVNAVRAALPNALIVIVGTLYAAAPTATFSGHITALGEAATDRGVPFINPSTWFTGTGTDGSPAGNGNADYYRAIDTAHPSPIGHNYLGNRMAGAMQRILRGDMVAS